MKKALIIVIPLLLIIGGGAAAFFMGLIPGTKKKLPLATAATTAAKDQKVAAKPNAELVPTMNRDEAKAAPKETIDAQKGTEKLADLWNQMETTTLVKIIADWKDPELVKVLATMDDGKVAELMTAIAKDKPARASKLSKQLQALASVVPTPAGA